MFDSEGLRLETYSLFNVQNGKDIEVMNLKFDVETRAEIVEFRDVKIIWPNNSTKTPTEATSPDEQRFVGSNFLKFRHNRISRSDVTTSFSLSV